MKGVKLVHRAMPLKLERLQWFLAVGKHVSFLPNIGWNVCMELIAAVIVFLSRRFSLAAELASCSHARALYMRLPANLILMSIQKLCLYPGNFENLTLGGKNQTGRKQIVMISKGHLDQLVFLPLRIT